MFTTDQERLIKSKLKVVRGFEDAELVLPRIQGGDVADCLFWDRSVILEIKTVNAGREEQFGAVLDSISRAGGSILNVPASQG